MVSPPVSAISSEGTTMMVAAQGERHYRSTISFDFDIAIEVSVDAKTERGAALSVAM